LYYSIALAIILLRIPCKSIISSPGTTMPP
jgi:hypothetical protein